MRAASAAADPPLDPPAIRSSAHGLPTWSVPRPAANSCVWLVAHEDHAVAAQAPPHGAVGRGDAALEHAAGGRQLQPAHGEEVLERQRDAAQRRGPVALRGAAGVRGQRQLTREGGIEADPGVDGARRPVEGRLPAVARGDPRLARVEQLDGRQCPRLQERGGLEDAEVGGIGAAGSVTAGTLAAPHRLGDTGDVLAPDVLGRRRQHLVPDLGHAARQLRHARGPRDEPPVQVRGALAPAPDVDASDSPTESTARSTRPSMTPCSRARSSGRSAGPSWWARGSSITMIGRPLGSSAMSRQCSSVQT